MTPRSVGIERDDSPEEGRKESIRASQMEDRAAEKNRESEGCLDNEISRGCIHKVKNLEEMYTFLDTYDLPKIT